MIDLIQMFKSLRSALSENQIEAIHRQVVEKADASDADAAWDALQPLRRVQQRQEEAAQCLLRIVDMRLLPIHRALEILTDVYDGYSNNARMIGAIGGALQGARDIDDLNAEPSDHPLFMLVIDKLLELTQETELEQDSEEIVLDGLATAARMVARQRDAIAERSYKRLVEIDSDYAAYHYNLGLFFKTQGRFREGLLANQKAASLVDEPVDSYEWNTGICATGAGEAEIALQVWKRMGQTIEMGRFDLPDGRYPQFKVRLAERPLAERTAESDNPGLEETIWIERLSPCHGIIRSVLYQDLGVDYGDVILMDGAPITYHAYGDQEYPVFPHLATLVRRNFRFFDFAGTQDESGRIADASRDLVEEAIVYSHTENFQILCANCWRDPNTDHEHHDGKKSMWSEAGSRSRTISKRMQFSASSTLRSRIANHAAYTRPISVKRQATATERDSSGDASRC